MLIARRALVAVLFLVAPPLVAQPAAELDRRAALLVYRQALHENGDALALAARLLTERSARSEDADAETLSRLRERLLAASGQHAKTSARLSLVPGGSDDLVGSLVARHAGSLSDPPLPRLLPTWSQVESDAALADLVVQLRAAARGASGPIWRAALEAAYDEPALATALDPILEALTGADLNASLQAWHDADPALAATDLDVSAGPGWLARVRTRLASALADPDHVDPVITAQLRAQWFRASRLPDADEAALAVAGLWIGLRDSVPSLEGGDPVPYLSALLAGAQRLALLEQSIPAEIRSELERGLALLTDLAGSDGSGWRHVDVGLAEIHETVITELERVARDPEGGGPRQRPLLLAEARLTLTDDDWEAYLMQPFREPVQQALVDCFPGTNVSAALCRTRFENWALDGAGIPEASGDVGGPFESEHLLRETELNPWQRINYLRGFWRMLLARECSGRERVINALEWALASRAYLEVVEREPSPGNGEVAAGLGRLADAGASLIRDLGEFGACRAQGRGPLWRILSIYATAVNRLSSALPRAADAFREQVLAPGSDVSLDEGPEQATEYAPQAMTVAPCDGAPACGVSQALPASAGLYSRFPSHYRVADQVGLGSLDLCYGDVSWVERRSEPVRAGGGVMANFHGRLSFRVRGRYAAGGEVRDVFVLRVVTEREYPYLFGPDRPEVLADPCPQEFQGRQSAGELPSERGWLVPRRLTFLSGERTAPSRLFTENWTRGEKWLERLAGDGAEMEKGPPPAGELRERLAARLATLRERSSAYLYEHLLAPMPSDPPGSPAERLTSTALELSAMRRSLDAAARLLVPRSAMLSVALRGSLYGDNAMVGPVQIREWRDAGRDPRELPGHARQRLESSAGAWRDRTGGAEIAPFVARTLIDLLGARAELSADAVSEPGADAAGAASPPPAAAATDRFP